MGSSTLLLVLQPYQTHLRCVYIHETSTNKIINKSKKTLFQCINHTLTHIPKLKDLFDFQSLHTKSHLKKVIWKNSRRQLDTESETCIHIPALILTVSVISEFSSSFIFKRLRKQTSCQAWCCTAQHRYQEIETGASLWVQGQPCWHRVFQASLSVTMTIFTALSLNHGNFKRLVNYCLCSSINITRSQN